MVKKDFLDILFWLILILLLVYAFGKLAGLFSPIWLDILPIIGIVFAAGIVYQKLITFMDSMDRRTDYFKNNLDKLTDKTSDIDKRVFHLEKQQDLFLSTLIKKVKNYPSA